MDTTATVRETCGAKVQRVPVEELAQHLATLEQELSDSGTIELVRGDTVIAELRAKPKTITTDDGRVIPDFMAQMREVFGDYVFPDGTGLKWINEDRDDR
jgi:hypothetical protein